MRAPDVHLLPAVACAVLSGCFAGTPNYECSTPDGIECPQGFTCIDKEKQCHKVCVPLLGGADCPATTDVCDNNGVCMPSDNPACSADANCTNPGRCQEFAGARCVGALCRYAPSPAATECDDLNDCSLNDQCDGQGTCVPGTAKDCPPRDNQCLANDTRFRSYMSVGTCRPADGLCEYGSVELDCLNCTATCLAACQGVVCDDTNGGCQWDGYCAGQVCVYTMAVDGSACDFQTGDGVCDAGNCRPLSCSGPQDCDDGNPCTADTCPGNTCAFTPLTGSPCGLCSTCNALGRCEVVPADDPACLTIDCDGLDSTCRDHADLTATRCVGFGQCAEPNSTACTSYVDAPDGTACGTGNCAACGAGACGGYEPRCTGNCDTCVGSGTTFNCLAEPTLCTGSCDTCVGSGTNFSCVGDATLCTGNCDLCQGSGTAFDCAANATVCTGNCDVCSGSGAAFNCTANDGACTGGCDVCQGSGIAFDCAADATLCTGNCDVCQGSGTAFSCAADATPCTGNCDVCQGSGTTFNCGANATLCTGTCDVCQGSGTAFNCAADATLCTGNCDACAGSGTTFNCAAVPALCTGNCAVCNGGGTTFNCAAVPAPCTGNCAACNGSGTTFNCGASFGLCTGNCDVCNGSGTTFNCAASATLCTGNCDVCNGSGTTFRCAANSGACKGCAVCTGGGTSFSCSGDGAPCPGPCTGCTCQLLGTFGECVCPCAP